MDSAEVREDESLDLHSGPGNSEGRICREAGQGFWKQEFRVFKSRRLEGWSHQGQKQEHRVWKRPGVREKTGFGWSHLHPSSNPVPPLASS